MNLFMNFHGVVVVLLLLINLECVGGFQFDSMGTRVIFSSMGFVPSILMIGQFKDCIHFSTVFSALDLTKSKNVLPVYINFHQTTFYCPISEKNDF